MRLPERVLEPVERIAEILFGLIMTLTFTSAISVLTADRVEVRTVLIGALGCNIAWGIIDGGLYLMACLAERGRNALLVRAVREAASAEDAHRVIADALPSPLASGSKRSVKSCISSRAVSGCLNNVSLMNSCSKPNSVCFM